MIFWQKPRRRSRSCSSSCAERSSLFPGRILMRFLRNAGRIVAKVKREYVGEYVRVVGVVRASAVFQNAADLARLITILSDDGTTSPSSAIFPHCEVVAQHHHRPFI